jgi:hypothetical protein
VRFLAYRVEYRRKVGWGRLVARADGKDPRHRGDDSQERRNGAVASDHGATSLHEFDAATRDSSSRPVMLQETKRATLTRQEYSGLTGLGEKTVDVRLRQARSSGPDVRRG